jgi:hypothetical protein
MSLNEVVVEGTLKPDGTLELDRKPNLSPGRVTVLLRQQPTNGEPSSPPMILTSDSGEESRPRAKVITPSSHT